VGDVGRGGGGLTPQSLLERIAAALSVRGAALAERDPPFREAAVALVLQPAGDDASLLLIRRAEHFRDPWSGQIGLPGGRAEPADATLFETAIRETREETALDLASAQLLGQLDELRPRTPALPPIIVRPFVVSVTRVPPLVPSAEVAELFWAPLSALFDPASARQAVVEVRGVPRTVQAIDYEGRIIWGMTERILRTLSGVLSAAP
jgi:8-oxo-dGTP pyrophosphatase MutT (NUDIX family)